MEIVPYIFKFTTHLFGSMLIYVGNEMSNPKRQNTNKLQSLILKLPK